MSESQLKAISSSRLDGKVALVTGAAQGIGGGIAYELGLRGASVIVNYSKSAEAALEVVAAIEECGSKAIAIKADISKPEEIKFLFGEAKKQWGKLDIVVSNAGIEHFDSIDKVTPEDFDRVFGLNTRGQFFVAQQAFEQLSEGGRLVLMSSISANAGGVRNHAVYAGSKAAIEAFTRSLAGDFGVKKITVNCIAPGGVKSNMARSAGWRYIPGADPSWSLEKIEEVVSKWTPLGRMAIPEDIARVVRFLVSEDGGWINGQTITISGGAGK